MMALVTHDHHHAADGDGDGASTFMWDCAESAIVLALLEMKRQERICFIIVIF